MVNSSIQNILKNIMYIGILRSGETQSEVFPELQIISQEQFDRVASGRQQRSTAYEERCAAAWEEVILQDGTEIVANRPPRNCPKRNSGKTLLSGNVYCGHCGGRIFASTARKSHHPTTGKDNERIPIYKCYNRTQHFGKVAKVQYNAGTGLTPTVGSYNYIIPAQELPKIIATNSGTGSIAAIRSYFCDEQVLRGICGYTGFSYDELIGGDYKLIIEPLAAFL